jgi:dihydroflavonol-4-reductase
LRERFGVADVPLQSKNGRRAMNNSEQVLVTGASGFVGSAVARALVRRGARVRALVRTTSPRAHLDKYDIEFVEGDLRDAESLGAAMAGVRYLFHVAADYRLWARDPREIVRNNITATRNIMEAARAAGVERIVHTSSIATLMGKGTIGIADESVRQQEHQVIGAYKRSKLLTERMVEDMAADGLPVVIVNPTTPIGPSDVRPTPTGRIIVEAASGRMPGFVDTGLNFVHVDDVAAGHIAAIERGKTGERYILGGQNATLAEFLRTIADRIGAPAPVMRIPRRLVYPIAYGAEALAQFTGREPFVTVDGLRMAKLKMYATAAKAERELGFTARPYALGVHDAIAWFERNGYLGSRRRAPAMAVRAEP